MFRVAAAARLTLRGSRLVRLPATMPRHDLLALRVPRRMAFNFAHNRPVDRLALIPNVAEAYKLLRQGQNERNAALVLKVRERGGN